LIFENDNQLSPTNPSCAFQSVFNGCHTIQGFSRSNSRAIGGRRSSVLPLLSRKWKVQVKKTPAYLLQKTHHAGQHDLALVQLGLQLAPSLVGEFQVVGKLFAQSRYKAKKTLTNSESFQLLLATHPVRARDLQPPEYDPCSSAQWLRSS
jgi:hypothetical protein